MKKLLIVSVGSIILQKDSFDSLEYIVGSARSSFIDTFKIPLSSIHETLFTDLIIVLYKKSKPIAMIKHRLKEFSDDGYRRSIEIDITSPKYIGTQDYYDFYPEKLGTMILGFQIEYSDQLSAPVHTENTLVRRLLNIFFEEEKAEMYQKLLGLILSTQKGGFLGILNEFIGFLSANSFYSTQYNQDLLEEEQMLYNRYYNSNASYGNLPMVLVTEAINCLHYSAASFGVSIITWNLKKRKGSKNIKDRRRRTILERLDIEDHDLFIDYLGDENSLAFLAFFESTGRMVVSFKGTTSGSEALHDINCEYSELHGGYVHGGIQRLVDHFIRTYWDVLYEEMNRRKSKSLLFTGHSLGAAGAILTYISLQEMGLEATINMNVLCFGPPPVVSKSLAERNFPNIGVFIYGSDIVTRLSYGSVLDLKYLCASLSSLRNLVFRKGEMLARIKQIRDYLKSSNINTKLYHPGVIYHVKSFAIGSNVVYRYKKSHHTFFDEIICSSSAPFDHIIHRLMDAFDYSESTMLY